MAVAARAVRSSLRRMRTSVMMKTQCVARDTVPKHVFDNGVSHAAKIISVARDASWNIHENRAL
jgi:hypothetical protein